MGGWLLGCIWLYLLKIHFRHRNWIKFLGSKYLMSCGVGSEAICYNVVSGFRQGGRLRRLGQLPSCRRGHCRGLQYLFSILPEESSSNQLFSSDNQRLHWGKSTLRKLCRVLTRWSPSPADRSEIRRELAEEGCVSSRERLHLSRETMHFVSF